MRPTWNQLTEDEFKHLKSTNEWMASEYIKDKAENAMLKAKTQALEDALEQSITTSGIEKKKLKDRVKELEEENNRLGMIFKGI